MIKMSLFIALLVCWVAPAQAQYNRAAEECWNPRAGNFEGVRPGEVQNDLDFRRCRPVGDYRTYDRNATQERDNRYIDRDIARECWNPGARHFETVRPNERQDDLDFGRCRPVFQRGYENQRGYEQRGYDRRDVARECWNPRAGHFERVREGEQQDDLDFGRCRRL